MPWQCIRPLYHRHEVLKLGIFSSARPLQSEIMIKGHGCVFLVGRAALVSVVMLLLLLLRLRCSLKLCAAQQRTQRKDLRSYVETTTVAQVESRVCQKVGPPHWHPYNQTRVCFWGSGFRGTHFRHTHDVRAECRHTRTFRTR